MPKTSSPFLLYTLYSYHSSCTLTRHPPFVVFEWTRKRANHLANLMTRAVGRPSQSLVDIVKLERLWPVPPTMSFQFILWLLMKDDPLTHTHTHTVAPHCVYLFVYKASWWMNDDELPLSLTLFAWPAAPRAVRSFETNVAHVLLSRSECNLMLSTVGVEKPVLCSACFLPTTSSFSRLHRSRVLRTSFYYHYHYHLSYFVCIPLLPLPLFISPFFPLKIIVSHMKKAYYTNKQNS